MAVENQDNNQQEIAQTEIDKKTEVDVEATIDAKTSEDKNQLVGQLKEVQKHESRYDESESIKSTTGLIPKKLGTTMLDRDFNSFKECIEKNDIDGFKDFIKSYKDQHPNLSDDNDIISLGMMRLLMEGDELTSEAFNLLYQGNMLSVGQFVALDEHGKNAILYALEKALHTIQLSGCIFVCPKENETDKKFILEQSTLTQMADAIHYYQGVTHPRQLIDKIIKPIYTAESVQDLVETIGKDWLDSYYT